VGGGPTGVGGKMGGGGGGGGGGMSGGSGRSRTKTWVKPSEPRENKRTRMKNLFKKRGSTGI